jgi:hypothetical protein
MPNPVFEKESTTANVINCLTVCGLRRTIEDLPDSAEVFSGEHGLIFVYPVDGEGKGGCSIVTLRKSTVEVEWSYPEECLDSGNIIIPEEERFRLEIAGLKENKNASIG